MGAQDSGLEYDFNNVLTREQLMLVYKDIFVGDSVLNPYLYEDIALFLRLLVNRGGAVRVQLIGTQIAIQRIEFGMGGKY